jgi:hypothetical protein
MMSILAALEGEGALLLEVGEERGVLGSIEGCGFRKLDIQLFKAQVQCV